MSDTRLAPLTPPECDLRGMEWMPLYGHRLFMSDFEARASDAEFRVALRLWWVSWQQVPAASLPNDDAVLCRLAGLGRDVKSWKRLKDGFVMHGFVECSDGRLYHRVLADEAREAWDRRTKERERKAAYRAKKHGTSPPGQDAHVPRDNDGTGPSRPTGTRALTRQDRTGQDSTPLPPCDLDGTGQPRPLVPPWNLDGVTARPADGRPVVNGWYLDRTWERVAEAAGIDRDGWRGDLKPLVGWLRDGVEPDTVVAAIERVAGRPQYAPPFSLAFFDGPVREQRVAA